MLLAGALALLAVAGVLFISNANQPRTVTVPVAASDIPAGTALHAPMFRGAQMSNIDSATLSRWVTVDEWAEAEGKVVIGDVRAGFPLAKSQIDPNAPSGMESRLSLAVTGAKDYYVVIPATPDQVGNFIQPGDKVDVVLSLGQLQARDLTASFPATIALGITATMPAPVGIWTARVRNRRRGRVIDPDQPAPGVAGDPKNHGYGGDAGEQTGDAKPDRDAGGTRSAAAEQPAGATSLSRHARLTASIARGARMSNGFTWQ